MSFICLSKIRYSCVVVLAIFQTIVNSQNLKVQPYEFITRANDTISAELGEFSVLKDRDSEIGDSIQLAFVRFKSTNTNPKSPIIYLSGGPGGSGISTAKGNRFELFMKLRKIADVIAFDQRGTGLSNQLKNCPYKAKYELSKPIDKEEYVEKSGKTIAKCLEFWHENNSNLEAYNTTNNAKDLEDLRKVLNVDKISLWGISYGTHLAFEYIRLFEENIDKVVLASLEGPNETIKFPKSTEQFLFDIANRAKDNYGSSIKYPNLKDIIYSVHNRLKKNPIKAIYKNRRGKIDTIGISNFELQSAISTFYLKNPSDSRKLPKLYTQMHNGDFSNIASDVMIMKRYIYSTIRPMSYAMDIQSGISDSRKKIIEREIDKSILGSTINFLLFEWMNNSDLKPLPDEFRELKVNEVNALLLSGILDGRTYFKDGLEIAEKFKNGQHILIDNVGHDLYMSSPIIGNLVFDFFNGDNLNVKEIILKPVLFD